MSGSAAWTPDAVELAREIQSGERSVADVIQESIDRIEAFDGPINSVIHRLWQHRQITPVTRGPFNGVPLLVKDFGCQTAGDPYSEGMEVLRALEWTAPHDSVLAGRFRRAGFTIIGRTNVPELATSYTTEPAAYGATRNPWDVHRSVGGSSGGSAAAVALGLTPVAHGGDGGGSIRVPASMCGVVGLKPTRGRIPINDAVSYSGMLGTEGVLARSMRDVAAVIDSISGGTPADAYPSPVRIRNLTKGLEIPPPPLRIGIRTLLPYERTPAHAMCGAAVAATAKALERCGHHLFEVELPELDDPAVAKAGGAAYFVGVNVAVQTWSSILGRKLRSSELEPRNAWLMDMSRKVSATEFALATTVLQRHAKKVLASWTKDIDILLTPTVPQPPPLIGAAGTVEGPELGRFASPFNITGQPALSVPFYWVDDRLPIGIQLVGDMGREDLLLRLGRQLEQASPWHHRRPKVARATTT